MKFNAENVLSIIGGTANGSVGKCVEDYRITSKELKDFLGSDSIELMAEKLLVLKHMALGDVVAKSKQSKGIKQDVPKAVHSLLKKADKEGLYEWCKYVFEDKGDKTKYAISDAHMVITAPKELFKDVEKPYFIPSGLAYPDVSQVYAKEFPKHKGTITKAEMKVWKQRLRAEPTCDRWGKWYVPVQFDNGVVRLFNREFLEIAMQFLGKDELTLYTGKTRQGHGVGYVKEGDIDMVICPINVPKDAPRDGNSFWWYYIQKHSNQREA